MPSSTAAKLFLFFFLSVLYLPLISPPHFVPYLPLISLPHFVPYLPLTSIPHFVPYLPLISTPPFVFICPLPLSLIIKIFFFLSLYLSSLPYLLLYISLCNFLPFKNLTCKNKYINRIPFVSLIFFCFKIFFLLSEAHFVFLSLYLNFNFVYSF